MAKEKVLFILHLPPPVHGSSVVGKQIYDSEKINEKFNCIFINLSTSLEVNSIGKISLNKLFTFINILFKVFNVLLFQRIDKVYLAPTVSKKGLYKDYLVILIIKLFKVKRFYHLHNKGVSKRKKSKILNFLYLSFFKGVKVILLSQKLYKDVEEFVDIKDVFICPNGIKNEIDTIDFRKETNKERLNLLFLSNLISSKGVYVLLYACKELLNKSINFNCLFVGGEGDISKEVFAEKISELGLQNHVFYLGKKYDNEKNEIFVNSDIFVFPTFYHNETFGLVNVEAMMFGLPVISTDEGGITDIVEDGLTGYIVNKEDSTDLVNKIIKLIDKEKRISMGIEGRARFEEKFTLQIFEEKILTILDN
jgi:glycosyltransferase involved in cell wall biosynthesis